MTIQLDNHRMFAIFEQADKLTKADNGHSFETILKTKCIYCKRSPKVKTKCGYWFQTFLNRIEYIMLNPEDFPNLGIKFVENQE